MKTKLLLRIILCCFFIIPAIGMAQVQIGQDIDGEASGDSSGGAVSLSSDGTIVAIGASSNGVGTDSGHVRVYENVSGTWAQIGQDIDGESPNDFSGGAISLSSDGSIVAIGANGNDGNGNFSGHVRVYENVSGTWIQIGQDIDGEAVGDASGSSVFLSSDGTKVAIGARNNDANGVSSGHVRIFENVSGTWTQIGQDIDGDSANDNSGWDTSLSSDGSIVAIGTPTNNGNSGLVRVYENIGGTWTQIGQDIDGEAFGNQSGRSVSLSSDGTIIAIGATVNAGNGVNSGHARVYENVSGTWTQIGQDIDGEAVNDFSGNSVSLSANGTIIAIAAHQNDGNGSNSGHVRIYQNISGIWTQIGLDIDGEAANDFSGNSVSLSSDGATVAIGAQINDGNGTNSGHVRVYDLSALCTVNIPDANFKAELVANATINTDGNSEISCLEATAFTGIINVSNKGISDLTGIEAFTNITQLNCDSNQLTSLDISTNTSLTYLDCRLNLLISLVSANTSLTELYCANNDLTSLDVSANTSLNILSCHFNQLTSLNVSANTSLGFLGCSNNQLTSLDLSNNTSFTQLYCLNNALTSLNIANGNNTNVSDINIFNNPNLTCVQVDDVAYSTTNWTDIDATASFSTNCTLGIDEFTVNSIALYPNPTASTLNIETDTSIEKLEVYTIQGKKVLENTNSNSINLSNLSVGVYLLKAYTDSGRVEVRRVIKQ